MKTITSKKITNHAKQRTLERTDYKLSELKNISKHVFRYGYHIRRFSGDFYEYLRSKQISGSNYSVRVYKNHVYIFDTIQRRLLTVYPVPEQFVPVSNFFNTESTPTIIWLRPPYNNSYKNLYVSNLTVTEDIGLATEFRTRQKAENFIKNNNTISQLVRQGYEIVFL